MTPMNAQERELEYPHGELLPEPGHALEVAPGVRWIRMGLPFQLNHINIWLLRDELDSGDGPRPGWTVVDCGISDDATRALWERVFENVLEGLPVLRVIVTHMHPDHIGLAHWLTERWGARLWISAADYNGARLASASLAGFGGPRTAAFMASHGLVEQASVEQVTARIDYFAKLVPQVPTSYRRLLDGNRLTIGPAGARHEWVCQVGYGHAPEHMSLHSPSLGLLISGDMVLPRISTNVSVIDIEPEADPLRLYLDSLQRTRAVPAETTVLPSHGRPFRGLHTRIAQLTGHHDERLADVRAACAKQPQCAADLLPVLFKRKLDLHQTTFAMGEAIAHLHLLWYAGDLARRVDAEGIYRFAPAG
jgi:glyoxylase-like metal-dependent hydrolase (beta-lactamase superfamily II)